MTSPIERISIGLASEFRAITLNGEQARSALCTSLGTVGAVLVALTLRLDEPWWAGITAIAILQGRIAATARRSLERALGTLVGAAVGYGVAPLVDQHLLFQAACAIIVAVTVYGQEQSQASYAVLLGGVTAILVLFGTLSAPDQSLHLAVYRSLEVLTGIVVGCLVEYAIGSGAQGDELPAAPKPGVLAQPVDGDLLAIAATGGIAVALIPDIWDSLQLPGFEQTPITAFVILTASRHEPTLKALARLLGCLLGGAFGLAAMGLVADAALPWLGCLGGGLFVASFVHHGRSDASYVGHQAAIAIVLAMVQGASASTELLPAVDRVIGIVGGIAVILAMDPLLAPLQAYIRSHATDQV
jgi:uncharacterized membrane protein YccC